MSSTYRLIVSCPDGVGLVAAVSQYVSNQGGWIIEASQHADPVSGWFFMRYEILKASLQCSADQFRAGFAPIAASFQMDWRFSDSATLARVVLLASRETHCLTDLLYRWRSGELPCTIVSVISNHPDLRTLVEAHDVPFHWVAVERDNKSTAWHQIAHLLESYQTDTVVLARYMQIVPANLCQQYQHRMINIHHSFLPSFAGAKPYHQAYERGVKLIGATCHYVSEILDNGPIIEQDVVRVSHRHRVEDMVKLGRDVERLVLARGLRYHLEDRVLVHGHKTIILD